MGYLLFLPFLLHAKGGNEATLGVGLALIFAGGALGKACCGRLRQHRGVVRCVIATEAATALGRVSTLMLPLEPALVLLPFLGIVLNGTSSVLYGTVPNWRGKASSAEPSRCSTLASLGLEDWHRSRMARLPTIPTETIASPLQR